MEPSINKSGIFAPDFSERDTVMTNDRLKGFTYGAVAAASYGMNPLFALPLYGAGMSVDSVLFYRYFFAVVMLGILMKVKKQSFALKKTDILPLAVMGLLFSFSSFFLFESYNYMDAGIASTILFVYPVLVAIIMAVFFHEKVSFITMFSIALAFTGISLLYEGGDGKTLSMLGVLFVILSSLTYAIYIVGVNRSSLKELPTAKLTFYALLFGISIYVVRLDFCTALQPVPSPVLWANVLSLALFPTIISLVLMTLSIHLIGSCHIGGAGTGDGAVLRRSGVWRAAHSAHHARRTDDTYCRNTDNCGEAVVATGEEAHRLKSGSFFCRDKVFFAGYQKADSKKCSIFAA
jgi:drug/metabolite transporter (DMT)-like permease